MTDVAPERWAQFGKALQDWREDVLGYKSRTAFARERLPLTEDGNPNIRLAQDLEHSYRPGTYTKWSLEDAEKAYEVTHESVLAFLHGEADTLARASAASAGKPAEAAGYLTAGADGWQPPIADPVRRAADAPYAAPILDRLLELADAGVIDPSGAQMFGEGTADARSWDGHGAWVRAPRDRAWFIADIRRLEDGRAGNSGTGAAGA